MALDAVERQNPLVVVDWVNDVNPPVNMKPGRTKKLLMLALIGSLMLSIGAVIAFDTVDRRLRTVEDVEAALPVPVCAAIPLPLEALPPAQQARITELRPQSLSSEAYRFLGLQVLNARERGVRSIMALSAKAGQGSTDVVTNLAITLAQAGYRVVVVDANIRTPKLHEVFNLPNDYGFMNLLEPGAGLSRVLHSTSVASLQVIRQDNKRVEAALLMALQQTSTPNLNVITSGVQPENPWELFRSPYLKEISKSLEEIADFVLFDTPSALAFTDALNLSPIVDGAFLCMRSGDEPTGLEQRLCDMLKQANVENLGVVLNDIPASQHDPARNYEQYYPPILRTSIPSRSEGGVATASVHITPPKSLLDTTGEDGEQRNTYVIRDKGSMAG